MDDDAPPVTVELQYPEQPVTITVFGKSYELEPAKDGSFNLQIGNAKNQYGLLKSDQRFTGSPSHIVKQLTEVEVAKSTKRERSKRLKEAATEPEPALLYHAAKPAEPARTVEARYGREARVIPPKPAQPVQLEKVGIRGRDGRTDRALIIRADGSNDTAGWPSLLRPLAGVEAHELLRLSAEAVSKELAIPKGTNYGSVKVRKVKLVAVYDEITETWEAEFDGHTLREGCDYRVGEKLGARAHALLVGKKYPYTVRGGTTLRRRSTNYSTLEELSLGESFSSFYRGDLVFKTVDEVEEYVKAVAVYERAVEKLDSKLESLLFDKSVFTE